MIIEKGSIEYRSLISNENSLNVLTYDKVTDIVENVVKKTTFIA